MTLPDCIVDFPFDAFAIGLQVLPRLAKKTVEPTLAVAIGMYQVVELNARIIWNGGEAGAGESLVDVQDEFVLIQRQRNLRRAPQTG
jgi:hypothetical protein